MNVGVIGVGKLGSIHLRIYKEIKGIEKIYLVDTDESKAAVDPALPFLTDYRQLLGKVDAVSIVSSTPTHYEISKFFLENKVPVLVEKPLTADHRQAQAVTHIAKENKTLLVVGHVERHNNAYLEAKKIVKDPLFIECHRLNPYPYRSTDTSVILDLMIHDLDIILDLVKDTIKTIHAKGVTVLSSTPDIANARIAFSNGCVANVTSSRISAKKERKIRIFMPHAYISLDYAEQSIEIYQKKGDTIDKKVLPIRKEEPLKKEIVAFVRLVKEKEFSLEYAHSAREALSLGLRIQKLVKKEPLKKPHA